MSDAMDKEYEIDVYPSEYRRPTHLSESSNVNSKSNRDERRSTSNFKNSTMVPAAHSPGFPRFSDSYSEVRRFEGNEDDRGRDRERNRERDLSPSPRRDCKAGSESDGASVDDGSEDHRLRTSGRDSGAYELGAPHSMESDRPRKRQEREDRHGEEREEERDKEIIEDRYHADLSPEGEVISLPF